MLLNALLYSSFSACTTRLPTGDTHFCAPCASGHTTKYWGQILDAASLTVPILALHELSEGNDVSRTHPVPCCCGYIATLNVHTFLHKVGATCLVVGRGVVTNGSAPVRRECGLASSWRTCCFFCAACGTTDLPVARQLTVSFRAKEKVKEPSRNLG